MTNNEIRIAIAEVCGFNTQKDLPDYCSDLNAMHSAEGVLDNGGEWLSYCHRLAEVVDPNNNTNFKSCLIWPTTWPMIHATARQRAEAFLKTIGKWKD